MRRLIVDKPVWALLIFAILDLVCVGMGMGVPIFCILFGFLVGWVIARTRVTASDSTRQVLRQLLCIAAITSGFTLVVLAIIWGPLTTVLFDPNTDFANLGIPFILYEPKASFIGWQVLMMVISPFLQLLTTLFGAHVTLAVWPLGGTRSDDRLVRGV